MRGVSCPCPEARLRSRTGGRSESRWRAPARPFIRGTTNHAKRIECGVRHAVFEGAVARDRDGCRSGATAADRCVRERSRRTRPGPHRPVRAAVHDGRVTPPPEGARAAVATPIRPKAEAAVTGSPAERSVTSARSRHPSNVPTGKPACSPAAERHRPRPGTVPAWTAVRDRRVTRSTGSSPCGVVQPNRSKAEVAPIHPSRRTASPGVRRSARSPRCSPCGCSVFASGPAPPSAVCAPGRPPSPEHAELEPGLFGHHRRAPGRVPDDLHLAGLDPFDRLHLLLDLRRQTLGDRAVG